MKKVSKAARLGKQFKKLETITLIVIPTYFIGRILISIIYGI